MYISRLLALAAALLAALGAWLPFGAISTADSALGASGHAARVGVLPLDAGHLAIAGIAGAVVLVSGWRGRRGVATASAVSPLVLLFLPWLPFHVPSPLLIWQGPLAALLWCAVALALAAVLRRDLHDAVGRLSRHGAIAAGLLSVVVFSLAAWAASPSIPGGDEPHYLIITQSLLYDHDLKIENNHRQGDYHAYYGGDLAPDFARRGRNGAIYSIHPPGISALVLPAFAIGGYRAVVVFLILLASAACALAWWLAWRVSGSAGGAWFGWAAVTLSAPVLFGSFTVYPDGPGAAIVLTGFWALFRTDWEIEDPTRPTSAVPWALHGLALSLMPWLHTRFCVLAAAIGGLVLLRIGNTPNAAKKAAAFLAAPAVSAVAWILFFVVIYGTPDPAAPYANTIQSSFAFLPDGLGGVFFDQGFGMLATAPVLAFAIAGFVYLRRVAIDWIVIAIPYLLAVTTYAMWWAGFSAPARFVLVLILPLAIPAAVLWARLRSRGWRTVLVGSLVVTMWLSAVIVGAGGGRLGIHGRNGAGLTPAPWLAWANDLVDLPSAAPAFVPLPNADRAGAARRGFIETGIWLATAVVGTIALVWVIDRRRFAIAPSIAASAFGGGAIVMVASAAVWAYGGVDARTPVRAQLDALRLMSTPHALAVDVTRVRPLPMPQISSMTIEVPVRRQRGRGFDPRGSVAQFPAMPPGVYRVSVKRHGSSKGLMMMGVADDQFALFTEPIGVFERGITLSLPAGARVLTVRADEEAFRDVEAVDVQPLAIDDHPVTDEIALHAVRYEQATVFFLDSDSFPEPSAFWVGGARRTDVIVVPAQTRSAQSMLLRNAPVANTITLESDGWKDSRRLAPGEEWQVNVPINPRTGSALVHIATSDGFRPAEGDRRSRDMRFLGVYVKME